MKTLDKVEEVFIGTAILSTTIILFVNVVLRYVFSTSMSWAEELIKYIMIWIAFIGASVCVRVGAHVSIDFFLGYLSKRLKNVLFSVVYIIAICFTISMAYYGIKVIQFTIQTGQVSPALQIPMWIPYLAIPLGFSLMTLRFGQEFLKVLTNEIQKS